MYELESYTYIKFLSSTSKTKVALGGIAGGEPFEPYLKHIFFVTKYIYTQYKNKLTPY